MLLSTAERLKKRVLWTTGAAVVAAVGVVAGWLAAPIGPPDAGGGAAVIGHIDGDCNANGVSNVVTCKAQGPSMAGVRITDDGYLGLWFDGPPERLPAPPSNVAGRRVDCDDEAFRTWIRSTDGFYFFDTVKRVTLTAGEPDLVTLTGAAVTLLERKPVSFQQGTLIICLLGGGGYTENYQIELDSQTRKSTLYDVPADRAPDNPRPMPPADISLGTKSEAQVTFNMKSKINHAYHGYVTLDTSSNGTPARLTIGSETDPLRWVEFSDREPMDQYYGLDDTGHWVKNWTPF
jgi:hypothetical protein